MKAVNTLSNLSMSRIVIYVVIKTVLLLQINDSTPNVLYQSHFSEGGNEKQIVPGELYLARFGLWFGLSVFHCWIAKIICNIISFGMDRLMIENFSSVIALPGCGLRMDCARYSTPSNTNSSAPLSNLIHFCLRLHSNGFNEDSRAKSAGDRS